MTKRNSMGRRQMRGYVEEDAYTEWRRRYCYLSRAGAVKSIKRVTHKRERRENKAAIRDHEAWQ